MKNEIFVSPRLSNHLWPYAANRGNAAISCVFLGQPYARYGG
jgi:hypothetical protein